MQTITQALCLLRKDLAHLNETLADIDSSPLGLDALLAADLDFDPWPFDEDRFPDYAAFYGPDELSAGLEAVWDRARTTLPRVSRAARVARFGHRRLAPVRHFG